MAAQTSAQLRQGSCQPCEGGVPKLSPEEAAKQVAEVPGWELDAAATAISKSWTCKNFAAAMEFLNRVAQIAEKEQHHPDLHLTGYKKVRIALMTHAIGGLSENDFILAAKVDEVA